MTRQRLWVVIICIWAVVLTAVAAISREAFLPSWRVIINPELYRSSQPLYRWDAQYYVKIASSGYTSLVEASFFPGYPLLLRFAHTLIPLRWDWVGAMLSFVCFIIATMFMGSLRVLSNDRLKWRVFMFTLLAPTAFVFFTAYSESLFWFLTILLWWSLERSRVLLAIIAAAGAALTRPFGIFLLVPLLALLWRTQRRLVPIAILAVVLPLLLWNFHLSEKLQIPFPPLHSQLQSFDQNFGFNFQKFINRISNYPSAQNPEYRILFINRVIGMVAALLGLVGLYRLGAKGWFWASVLMVAFIYGAVTISSANRYVFSFFPLVLGLGSWFASYRRLIIIPLSAGLLIINTILFSIWFYVV